MTGPRSSRPPSRSRSTESQGLAPRRPKCSRNTRRPRPRPARAGSRRWRSGLVYLWVKEVPAGTADAILEGVSGFFRRIPARTNVYATLYGRKRQPIPKLRAGEIGGQLHDIGFLAGDRPNLADAIRVDLKALLGDEAPFKVMLVVTDGRDYTDTSGDSVRGFRRGCRRGGEGRRQDDGGVLPAAGGRRRAEHQESLAIWPARGRSAGPPSSRSRCRPPSRPWASRLPTCAGYDSSCPGPGATWAARTRSA